LQIAVAIGFGAKAYINGHRFTTGDVRELRRAGTTVDEGKEQNGDCSYFRFNFPLAGRTGRLA